MHHQLCEFNSAFFGNKKIVVVKFNGISTIFLFQKKDILVHVCRRFPFPACVINGNNGAKGTGERATETGMICNCFSSKACFTQVLLDRIKSIQPVVWKIWQCVLIINFIALGMMY